MKELERASLTERVLQFRSSGRGDLEGPMARFPTRPVRVQDRQVVLPSLRTRRLES